MSRRSRSSRREGRFSTGAKAPALDGRPYGPEVIFAKDKPATWKVELPPENHRLSVLVKTAVSDILAGDIELTYKPPMASDTRPSLHVLAIGINTYPGDWKLAIRN